MPASPRAVRRAFSDARVSLAGRQRLGHLHGRVDRRLLQVDAGGVLAAEVQAPASLQRTQRARGRGSPSGVISGCLNRRSSRMCFGSARRRSAHDLNTSTVAPDGRRVLQGAEPDAALASATVDARVVGRPVAAIGVHVGRVGVDQQARVEVPVLVEQRRDVVEGAAGDAAARVRPAAARSAPRTDRARAGPPGVCSEPAVAGPPQRLRRRADGARARRGCGPAGAAGCPAARSSSCTSWRRRRCWPGTPARRSAGSTAPTLAARRPASTRSSP